MSSVFRFHENQPVVWWHKTLEKSNQECLYCGSFIGDGSLGSNKEHLICRMFGPSGCFSTGQEFNFIFRACEECNADKSAVERHLSTVTLFNSPERAIVKSVDESAVNKAAKDAHPVSRILVQDSHTEICLSYERPGVKMTFGLIAPPQAVPNYVKSLALSHIQGLFSLATTRDPTIAGTTSLLPEDHFQLFGSFGHGDWGNPQLIEIYKRASVITGRVLIETAGGFFKAVMRRSDGIRGEWFWALEWNKSLRVFGGITDRKPPLLFDALPPLDWFQYDATSRIRAEIPLKPEEDILFDQ